jgi:hypothetical protein
VIAKDDDVLTKPIRWSWTAGMEHDPVEPRSQLLPGRADAPAPTADGCSAVGQFESQSAAAAAADALSGICVAETVILPAASRNASSTANRMCIPPPGFSTSRFVLPGGSSPLKARNAPAGRPMDSRKSSRIAPRTGTRLAITPPTARAKSVIAIGGG